MTEIIPAPWNLNGNGYVFLYRFPEKKSEENFFTADLSGDGKHSGFGTIMIVDYKTSTAGPYQELLFIPGKFRFKNKKYYSITKIYVSTMVSVVSGRKNWGIPKELADFKFADVDKRKQKIIVSKDGNLILEMIVKNYPIIFPVSTKFIPIPLLQKMDGKLFLTRFNGRGKGKPALIESIFINPDFFPRVSDIKPLLGIKVENFQIEFPLTGDL